MLARAPVIAVLAAAAATSACGEALEVTDVDVVIEVEGAAPAPLGVIAEMRQDCGLEADGALQVCECPYSTDVGLVRLRYRGDGSFLDAAGGAAPISEGNVVQLRFEEVTGAYSGAPIYGFTPQLESTPTDPPELIDEAATLDDHTVAIRYQIAAGVFVNETHAVQATSAPQPIARPGHDDPLDCVGDCRAAGVPLPFVVLLAALRRRSARR